MSWWKNDTSGYWRVHVQYILGGSCYAHPRVNKKTRNKAYSICTHEKVWECDLLLSIKSVHLLARLYSWKRKHLLHIKRKHSLKEIRRFFNHGVRPVLTIMLMMMITITITRPWWKIAGRTFTRLSICTGVEAKSQLLTCRPTNRAIKSNTTTLTLTVHKHKVC